MTDVVGARQASLDPNGEGYISSFIGGRNSLYAVSTSGWAQVGRKPPLLLAVGAPELYTERVDRGRRRTPERLGHVARLTLPTVLALLLSACVELWPDEKTQAQARAEA